MKGGMDRKDRRNGAGLRKKKEVETKRKVQGEIEDLR